MATQITPGKRGEVQLISRFLDETGDGTGNHDATGNYLLAPTSFIIKPAVDEVFEIFRMLVSFEGATGFRAAFYGKDIVLVNGIAVHVGDDAGVIFSLTGQENIYTNAGWGKYCYDADVKSWGAGNEVLLARWTFAKSGSPIILRGEDGDYLSVTLYDDFSALTNQHFLVQGHNRKSY